jgi:hypothetical protein
MGHIKFEDFKEGFIGKGFDDDLWASLVCTALT